METDNRDIGLEVDKALHLETLMRQKTGFLKMLILLEKVT